MTVSYESNIAIQVIQSGSHSNIILEFPAFSLSTYKYSRANLSDLRLLPTDI